MKIDISPLPLSLSLSLSWLKLLCSSLVLAFVLHARAMDNHCWPPMSSAENIAERFRIVCTKRIHGDTIRRASNNHN